MKKREKGKPISINHRLLAVVFFCWLVPVLLIVVFMTVSYRHGMIEQTEGLLSDELNSSLEFLSVRLDNAIARTKETTYDRNCENAWKRYSTGQADLSYMHHVIDGSLKSKFYLDNRFDSYAYYITEQEEPFCYSSRAGEDYQEFVDAIGEKALEIRGKDTSDAHVEIVGKKIYIIRNLFTTNDYERFGTFVAELNREYLFQDARTTMGSEILLHVSDRYTEDESGKETAWLQMMEKTKMKGIEKLSGTASNLWESAGFDQVEMFNQQTYRGIFLKKKYDDYFVGVVMLVKHQVLYSQLYDLYKVVAVVSVIIIPVFFYIVYFAKKHITMPIAALKKASERMEEGQLGTVVEIGQMPNAEFNYLMESFNHMSSQVKCLFDFAYDEQIARKDAKILALQAQINPHFLNNTLEMMNWQARMSGDVTVCKMIEALGTVLDYRMDRSNRRLIHLAEEIRCADAYFYIISMRFGKRLMLEKDIDETLLQMEIPQLILQPIIENAVVHGIEQVKSGIIRIHVYHEETCVYLQVANSGKPISQEEQERIQQILEGDASKISQGKGHHTSLGIRNVNERIKLIYGEEYGLSITSTEEGMTSSVITLPYEEDVEKHRESEKQKVQNELKNMGRKQES